MRVLLANKFFYLKGGAEAVFFDTANLLRAAGHKVAFFAMHHARNADSHYARHFVSNVDFIGRLGPVGALKASGRILYSLEARGKLERLLQQERPDVAHLHNIYHQLSPSILGALAKHDIPVVMTLHDFKVVCPTYLMLLRQRVCEKCRGGAYYHCLLERCSKDSYLRSLLNTAEMYLHHRVLHSYRTVDAFVSPSRFLRDKVREMGFLRTVHYLPNSVNPGDYPRCFDGCEPSVVYSGRLSAEKGLMTLIDAVEGLPVTCRIIGEGPMRPALEQVLHARRQENVALLGHKGRDELIEELSRSMFVVVPSEWYENCPRSVIEAYACGKPVVGSRIGGIPELVEEGKTGVTFTPGDVGELRQVISRMLNEPERVKELGKNARACVETRFNHRRHLAGLLEIYREAIGNHAAS